MGKKLFAAMGVVFVAATLLLGNVARGYGDDQKDDKGGDLYTTSLTGSDSSTYKREVDAKISISKKGEVELSVKNLELQKENRPVSASCTLVIDMEINDKQKTLSKTFYVENGEAELKFTVEEELKEELNNNDKLEIINVVVNKVTSATPTPTAIATPASSPTGTPTSSPAATPTATPAAIQAVNVSTSTGNEILVPGGLITGLTTPTATPTPETATSPTPTATPTGVITAEVSIKPETINLKSTKTITAFITFPSHNVEDIQADTVTCNGAKAIGDGEIDENRNQKRFIAKFNTKDLDLGFKIRFNKNSDDAKFKKDLKVSGKLTDGTEFEGSDEVTIKGKGKKLRDDNDD